MQISKLCILALIAALTISQPNIDEKAQLDYIQKHGLPVNAFLLHFNQINQKFIDYNVSLEYLSAAKTDDGVEGYNLLFKLASQDQKTKFFAGFFVRNEVDDKTVDYVQSMGYSKILKDVLAFVRIADYKEKKDEAEEAKVAAARLLEDITPNDDERNDPDDLDIANNGVDGTSAGLSVDLNAPADISPQHQNEDFNRLFELLNADQLVEEINAEMFSNDIPLVDIESDLPLDNEADIAVAQPEDQTDADELVTGSDRLLEGSDIEPQVIDQDMIQALMGLSSDELEALRDRLIDEMSNKVNQMGTDLPSIENEHLGDTYNEENANNRIGDAVDHIGGEDGKIEADGDLNDSNRFVDEYYGYGY